jgi:Mn2+/Fe2+ NRAMP family transporter
VAAWRLHPPIGEILKGLVPNRPQSDSAHYWFVAISILGATVSPYMFHFYGSGAVEDKWTTKDLGANRLVAIVGTSFGAVITVGVLLTSAMVFHPRGMRLDTYEQISLMLAEPFGRAGFYLFAASLAVGCFGAAAEIALGNAYMISQTLGWNWGEDLEPAAEARFSLTYTVFLLAASLLILAGLDPLKLTLTTMALTAVILPAVAFPFLLLMNDDKYVGKDRNGWLGNGVVTIVIALSFVLAIITIPLEILGG